MSRVLIAGVLTTSVLFAAPVPKENSDTFQMRRVYGSIHDPDKDSTFKPAGNLLHVGVPPESRLLGFRGQSNAPRVWRDVRGDFTVTVRVSFPIRSEVPAKLEGVSASRSGGGLVIWLDDDHFLAVTRDECERDKWPGEYFRAEMHHKTSFGRHGESIAEAVVPGKGGYLSAQRKGKEFTASFSTDGKKWKVLRRDEMEWGADLKVGVVAENSFKVPFEVVFDEYHLSVSKK